MRQDCNNKKNKAKGINIMQMIADRAKEILGVLAYNSYKNLIRAICECDKFDYVILVDRKGAAVFRAFLRILKKVDGFGAEGIKPKIISTRAEGSYLFKEGDTVLLFDDVLGTGRNIKRIVENLRRRNLRNIEFAAFAYSEKSLLENNIKQAAAIILDKNKEPIIDFCEKEVNRDGNTTSAAYLYSIPIFFNYIEDDENNSFLLNETKYNGNYFLNEKDSLVLSERFNRVVHYSLTPYSAYMAHAHFFPEIKNQYPIHINKEIVNKFTYIEPKSDGAYSSLPLDIATCDGEAVMANLYYREECDFLSENGYFIGARVFHNLETNEYLVCPRLFLPSLNKNQIIELSAALGFSNTRFEIIKEREKLGFAFNDSHELFLSEKSIYESVTRRIVAVISAVYGIDFLLETFRDEHGISIAECIKAGNNNAKEVYEDYILTPFAKSLARYYYADNYCLEKDNCVNRVKQVLTNAYIAINKNENSIFDFKDIQKYPAIENITSNYTSFRQLINRKDGLDEIADELRLILEQDEITTFEYIERQLHERSINKIDSPKMLQKVLCDTTDFLLTIDKKMHQYKLPPIPLFELMKKIQNKCGSSIQFPHIVAALDSCCEDGSLSVCYYGEIAFDQRYKVVNSQNFPEKYLLVDKNEMDTSVDKLNVLVSCYYQHGELSVLEWCKCFCGTFLYTLSNANREMESYFNREIPSVNKEVFRKQSFERDFMYYFSKIVEANDIEEIIKNNQYEDWISNPQPFFNVWSYESILEHKKTTEVRQKRDNGLAELLDIWCSYLKAKFIWEERVDSFKEYYIKRKEYECN